jgi:hypothetical protein
MVVKVTKASAMVFAVMVLTAVFGLLASVHVSTHKVALASDATAGEANNVRQVVAQAKRLGFKSGRDLVHDSLPSSEPGDYFHPENPLQTKFAQDVLILTDNAAQIKSETDLENYLHSSTRSEHLLSFENTAVSPSEVVAIWTVSDDDWASITTTNEMFLGAPSNFKEILLQNGFSLRTSPSPMLRDPDNNCNSAYACIRQDNNVNTGFHGVACYFGRWDGVWMAVNTSTNRKVSVYQTNGQLDTFEPSYGKTYSPSVSVDTVDIF